MQLVDNISPVHPTPTKIRDVAIKVAIVIPEIGFDDEPINTNNS